MTEPAKILNAEDVLTSIRRLLSQDGPVAVAPAAGPAAEPAAPLVLTPDFRVASPAEVPAADPEPPTLEDTLAALEAALTGRAEETDPEPAAAPEEAAADAAETVEEAPFIAVDMPEDPAPVAFRHTAEIRRLQLVTPPAPPAPADEPAQETGAEEMGAEEMGAPPPVAGHRPEAEDAGPAEIHPAEPPLAETSPAEREAETLAAPEPEEAPPAEPSLFDAPEEVPISLEALHQIVGDILRQELQGALGERMTRNVRKLVRAEIRRALAEQG